ncbi:MAG: rhomboid family intramembrane serine protease [Bdellovibrionaceae bacterium]|nr:rhomboid family intramembrane serine protease [Pseudobdellovibrionaceae bacterium]
MVHVILALNILIYLMWLFLTPAASDFMTAHFLVSWDALLDGRIWVLLTSAFSHNLGFHILLNMLVLQSFGGLMEQVLGSFRFFRFYLVAGILASLTHATISAFVLDQPDLPALGASGAIAGTVALFALLFPKEKLLIFGLLPLPAIWGAVVIVALDLWGLYVQAGGGGLPIGHGAHLGGAFTGVAYYFLFLRRRMRSFSDHLG